MPIQLMPPFIPIVLKMDDLLILYLGTRVVRKFASGVVLCKSSALAEDASSAQITRSEQRLRNFPVPPGLNATRASSESARFDCDEAPLI